MRRKTLAFCHDFFLLLCQNFPLLVQRTFLTSFFFEKLRPLLLIFWHLTKIKISLSSWKTWWGSQNFIFSCPEEHLVGKKVEKVEHFLSMPRAMFFWENKVSEKSVFYHLGTWGKNNGPLSVFFLAVMSKLRFTSPNEILTLFSEKLTTFLLTFWHLTKTNFSLWSRIIWRGFQNFSFSCPDEHLVGRKREKLEHFCQCWRLGHNLLASWQNVSCGVVSIAFYLLVGKLWWRKKFLCKNCYIFPALCFFVLWARKTGLFCWKIPVCLSKLHHSWPKTFCRKLPSLEKKIFCFFLFCQRRRLNKTYWRFLKINRLGCQNCIFSCP